LLFVIIISFIENHIIKITSYVIEDKKIPKEFDGFVIAHLTDLHNTSFGNNNEKLIDKVRKLSPDIIVVTGDMLVGHKNTDVTVAANVLNELTLVAPTYFSMGNHELRISRYLDTYGSMWDSFLKQLLPEVNLLFDEKTTVSRNDSHINLFGVTLNPKLYTRLKDIRMPKKHLSKRFGYCNNDEFNIFLAHNPEYFKDYAAWGADLTFAGHVHGGIVRIPFLGGVISPKLKLFPEYDKGLFEHSNKYMVLSGGLGNHTIKVRINNHPEIVKVTLKHTDKTT
jgi:hypothetical protein